MKIIFLTFIFCVVFSQLQAQKPDSLRLPALRYDDFCSSINNVVSSSHASFLENEEKELNVVNRDVFTSKLKFDGTYSTTFKKEINETHFLGVFYEGKNNHEADTCYLRLKLYLTNCISGSFLIQDFTNEQISSLSDGTIKQFVLLSKFTTNSKKTVIKLILLNDDQLLYRTKIDVCDLY
jgi:hypothetical protein